MQSACQSCTFFDQHHGAAARSDDAGLCRFNPPIPVPEKEEKALWPVVKQDDWCGHHTETRH
jgi:hypothetical protein